MDLNLNTKPAVESDFQLNIATNINDSSYIESLNFEDENLAATLDDIFLNGNETTKERTYLCLLASCHDENLSQDTRSDINRYLLQYLSKLYPGESDITITILLKKQLDSIIDLTTVFPRGCKTDHNNRKEVFKEKLQCIYSYLQTNIEDFDKQLIQGISFVTYIVHPQRVRGMCELVIGSNKNREVVEEAKQIVKLLPLPGSTWFSNDFYDYLVNKKSDSVTSIGMTFNFFTTMTWLPNLNQTITPKDIEGPIKSGLNDAINGSGVAMTGILKLAQHPKTCEFIFTILDQYHPDEATKLKDRINYEVNFKLIQVELNRLFKTDSDTSIEKLVEIGQICLIDKELSFFNSTNNGLVGNKILESISQLNHPQGTKARGILDQWLHHMPNRLWLIQQNCVEGARCQRDSTKYNAYANSLICQTNIVLDQIQQLKSDGNEKEARQLIHHLIDVAIEMELSVKFINCDKSIYSHFYQLLMVGLGETDSCHQELVRREKLCRDHDAVLGIKGQHLTWWSDSKEEVLNEAANMPGRTTAAYQRGAVYFEIIRFRNGQHYGTAEYIKKAIHYFDKVVSGKYQELAAEKRAELLKIIQDRVSVATQAFNEFKEQGYGYIMNKSHLIKALAAFRWAGIAGDDAAQLEYLRLRSSVGDSEELAENCPLSQLQAKLELAKLHLSNQNTSNDDLRTTKDFLEKEAEAGNIDAMLLLVKGYSSEKPKFEPGFFEDGETLAKKYLEQAVLTIFKFEKNAIYENNIPELLNNLAKQLDSDAQQNMFFELMEKFENYHTVTYDFSKLADVMLRCAVETGYVDADEKLQIKLQQKMKEQGVDKVAGPLVDADDHERKSFALFDQHLKTENTNEAEKVLKEIKERHSAKLPELTILFSEKRHLSNVVKDWYHDRGPLFTRIALKLAKLRWEQLHFIINSPENTEKKKAKIRELTGVINSVGNSVKNNAMKLELGEWYLTRGIKASSEEKERATNLLIEVGLKNIPSTYKKMQALSEELNTSKSSFWG